MTTCLQQTIRHFLLNGSFYDNSLVNGKVGIVIFFYLCSKHLKKVLYGNYAGELLDEVLSEMSVKSPVSISTGVAGLGWTIEFLISEGFIEGYSEDILIDLDKSILQYNIGCIDDYSIESGLSGIAFYILSRYANPNSESLFTDGYIKILRTILGSNCKFLYSKYIQKQLANITDGKKVHLINYDLLKQLISFQNIDNKQVRIGNVSAALHLILEELKV